MNWKVEASRPPAGHGVPITHDAFVERIKRDPSFGEGVLAAAAVVESLRVHVDDDPHSTCPDGCGWFNYAAMKLREAGK